MTDDDQRLKNLLLFKMYATDKEVEQISPYIALAVLVIGGGVLLFNWLSK